MSAGHADAIDRCPSRLLPWPGDPRATSQAEYPDMDQAAEAIHRVTELADLRCTAPEPGWPCWIDDHGLLVVASQTDTRIGFGVRESLMLSPRLIAAIAQVNQSDPLGHLWLTEGATEREWALIWGATLPHRWTHILDVQRAVYACLTQQREYLSNLVTHFARFGGVATPANHRPRSARGESRSLRSVNLWSRHLCFGPASTTAKNGPAGRTPAGPRTQAALSRGT